MTDKELFAKVRALGLIPKKVDGEYSVKVPGDDAGEYFTTDRDDALGTAQAMARRTTHAQ